MKNQSVSEAKGRVVFLREAARGGAPVGLEPGAAAGARKRAPGAERGAGLRSGQSCSAPATRLCASVGAGPARAPAALLPRGLGAWAGRGDDEAGGAAAGATRGGAGGRDAASPSRGAPAPGARPREAAAAARCGRGAAAAEARRRASLSSTGVELQANEQMSR